MPSDTAEMLMSEEEAEAIRQEVLRIIQAEGLSRADVAREMGMPYGTFTNWVPGKYTGRNDKQAVLAQKWLASRQQRAAVRASAPAAPRFVQTPTAEAVMTVLAHAQHMPDMCVVTGPPGIGKTSAACAYTRSNPNVFKVTGHPGLSSPRAALEELCRAVAVPESRALHKLAAAISWKLRGTAALVIVDEAQHLTSAALDQLRSLHDEAEVGVALIGNGLVFGRLEGQARGAEFAQLFSRVGMRLTNAREHRARLRGDADALLDAWGLEDKAARAALHAIARKPGALRGMVKTLKLAHLLANAAREPVGAATIGLAWQRLSETTLAEGEA